DPATNVSISDVLPAGTTFHSLAAPTGWNPAPPAVGATGTVAATIASLAPGASGSFSLVGHVDLNVADGTTIAHSAPLRPASTDPNSSNNSAGKSVTVQVSESLAPTTAALASSLNPATFGQTVTFTATVSSTTTNSVQPGGFFTFTVDGVSQAPVPV